MPYALEDSWTKLARGNEHMAALALECEEYLAAGPAFNAEAFYNPEAGTVAPQFSADPLPPARIGAIVGDVAQNLRSALDVAAWQLAIAHDEEAARSHRNRVTFPLTHRPGEFGKPHSALRFFSESARGVIERLQPATRRLPAI